MSLAAQQGHKEVTGDNQTQSHQNQQQHSGMLKHVFSVEADYCRLKYSSETEYPDK